MDVFISGVMQGSREDHLIGDQDYRNQIAQMLQENVPDVNIIDPWKIHPDSVNYDQNQAGQALLSFTKLVKEVDVLIAYLPQASMGTAVEMWTAFEANIPIISISSLNHNWVISVTSNLVLPDLKSLLEYIRSGDFESQWSNKRSP